MVKTVTLAAVRFGYGLPLPKAAPQDAEAMLQALMQPDLAVATWPIISMQDWVKLAEDAVEIRKLPPSAENDALRQANTRHFADLDLSSAQVSFARALDNPDGFRERLVAFWVDHFSVALAGGPRRLLSFLMVDEAIRPHLTADFASLLTAVTLHPAMLNYLDQLDSIGPNSAFGRRKGKGLNENLAREVMELHSLGAAADYSQADVTEMAKLLTGITFSRQDGVGFSQNRAEPGDETVLGQVYGGEGLGPIRQALSDLAHRPETAQHIARKLAIHFVSDDPDTDLVTSIAAAFSQSGGDLMSTYRALLDHPAAWVPETQKVRQPFDFLVAAARGLGLTGRDLVEMQPPVFRKLFLLRMKQLGQTFRFPDGPNGIPEAASAWITPQGLAERISWAMEAPSRLLPMTPDPVAFAKACLDDRASPDLLWSAERAEDRDQGVGLVLASAEFNRR